MHACHICTQWPWRTGRFSADVELVIFSSFGFVVLVTAQPFMVHFSIYRRGASVCKLFSSSQVVSDIKFLLDAPVHPTVPLILVIANFYVFIFLIIAVGAFVQFST